VTFLQLKKINRHEEITRKVEKKVLLYRSMLRKRIARRNKINSELKSKLKVVDEILQKSIKEVVK